MSVKSKFCKNEIEKILYQVCEANKKYIIKSALYEEMPEN